LGLQMNVFRTGLAVPEMQMSGMWQWMQ